MTSRSSVVREPSLGLGWAALVDVPMSVRMTEPSSWKSGTLTCRFLVII